MKQGSAEWLEARRSLVTATDIPILLGLSPYRCEADLADDKLGNSAGQESTIRMRVGSALEELIGQEYSAETGRKIRPWNGLAVHGTIKWAAASPDFRVVGDHRLVEAKHTGSRSRFADGLPQDVEAQVQWQLGVTGYTLADVAVLIGDDDLRILPVVADHAMFANLVTVAEDFRRRLAAGGPFAKDQNRVRKDYPQDDGSEIVADVALTDTVRWLAKVRSDIKELEATKDALETAIMDRMGPATLLTGDGFRVSWKRTKDRETTDWKSLSAGLLRTLPETESTALVGLHTTASPGFRPLRVVLDKED